MIVSCVYNAVKNSHSNNSAPANNCVSSAESLLFSPRASQLPSHPCESFPSVHLIEHYFLSNHSSGAIVSVFSNDVELLQRALACHGIMPRHSTISECQEMMIHHLLTGACVDFETDVRPGESRPNRATCRNIAVGFNSAAELACAALNVVVSADVKSLSTDRLSTVAQTLGFDSSQNNRRYHYLRFLKNRLNTVRSSIVRDSLATAVNIFQSFESLSKASLLAQASLHRIQLPSRPSVELLRSSLMQHITEGSCALPNLPEKPLGCTQFIDDYRQVNNQQQNNNISNISNTDLQIHILSSHLKKFTLVPLRRLLQMYGVEFHPQDSLSKLRRELKKYITRLKKGKYPEIPQSRQATSNGQLNEGRETLQRKWPQLVRRSLKDKILKEFRRLTSKEELSSFTCASCAEECLDKVRCNLAINDIDLTILRHPDCYDYPLQTDRWLDPDCSPPPLPYDDGPLKDILLDPAGVNIDARGRITLFVCKTCTSSLKKKKVPPLSLANCTFLGPVPDELKDLTVVEEAMIARCRSKCWVIQLKEERELNLNNTQRGMKGHVIIYPQRPSEIAAVLPPSLDDILTPICVIFIGSSPPSPEWLREKAKPLAVRREKVRSALVWLKEHNPHYKDITINHGMLNQLDDQQILPFSIEHILPSQASDVLTSRYDSSDTTESHSQAPNTDIPFQNVVITDVDAHAPANELRAAAVRHVAKKGGCYLEIPHDAEPVNEFCNPGLFPMIYPTLFPFGIGGFEDSNCASKLSMKRHVKHLFSLADRRFQEHYSFLFTAFNILQRRESLLHTSLKVKKSNFASIAANFASVSPQAVHVVSERVASGDFITANTEDERQVLNLMKQVKLISSHVPGSSASRIAMRNEIRGLMMEKGLPSFYITINPADVFNPLVKFMAGADIDIDNLLPEQVPSYQEQSILVARNPAIAAKFFHLYMQAFIKAILGYDPDQINLEGGILGVVKAYYGCVEAQGRGTLHCHMLVWLEGGLNPNEIKERIIGDNDAEFCTRLLSFLDDTISNAIPPDPDPNLRVPSSSHHPCSVRGVQNTLTGQDLCDAQQKDLHNLVKQCQLHTHSKTCYKYWKGPPDPKECRFDLDHSNVRPESSADMETGEICLRCLDGMVNNFNATILQAMRCNMDIKFIGSGASAKAILYYITDYITKTQLKTHVAFAALELAVRKLGEYDPTADNDTLRAKRMLQKCVYAMISHQELSSQQVCSYLMGFGDHYTSHEYQNLYWTSFEKYVNAEDPSPECYARNLPASDPTPANNEQDLSYFQSDDLGCSPDEASDDPRYEDDSVPDVSISVSPAGDVVPRSDQVADYVLRGDKLEDLCLWDNIAQIEKTRIPSYCADNMDVDIEGQDDHEGQVQPILLTINELLQQKAKKRPTVELCSTHLEAASHLLRVRSPNKRRVPVPIGPGIPRRDREETKARYCRLMLILFKPWRHSSDLRVAGQTWQDSFESFLDHCPPRFKTIMDNMQILHECRDSRDDHYALRRSKGQPRSTRASQELMGIRNTSDDFYGDDDDEGRILDHLESISTCTSQRSSASVDAANRCIDCLTVNGFFDQPIGLPGHTSESSELSILTSVQEVPEPQPAMEAIWRKAYEDRRDQSKRRSALTTNRVAEQSTSEQAAVLHHAIQDGSAFRTTSEVAHEVRLPAVRCDMPAADTNRTVEMNQIINEFSLNTEQERAFRIIAEHSMLTRPDPLRMYLGGPGGTGKSRVIQALTEFFQRQGQDRRFRLASYTGVAARNIQGMTLHSALCLNRRSAKSSSTHRDLVAMWEGVDYLFIDEVSMIGCNLLLQISEALVDAKGNTSPFGGISIIFCGDFAQLPPVGQTRLFAHLNTRSFAQSGTKQGQNAILGKLLWLSVKIVVILHEVKRQSGPGNERFVDLLGRLRDGKCTDSDYELLTTRVLGNIQPNWNEPSWANAPIIVAENTVKDALNEKAAAAFAQRTGQQLHWYYSEDSRGGTILTDKVLKTHLEQLHSGQTNQRLGKLPLVPGMPVMFTQNFDVENGIVNGSAGILKRIRYRKDNEGHRHAISCVVHVPDTTSSTLPHLPPHHVVALEDTVDMTFVNPHSKKKCLIKRTQLPIVPAFAMTAHKAQGKTLPSVIVDLECCRGTEAPYVMLSRVASLDGLLILRPFSHSRISCRQSEDLRREVRRLELLRLQTIVQVGSPEESNSAQARLANAGAELTSSYVEGSATDQVSEREVEVTQLGGSSSFSTHRKHPSSQCVIDTRPRKRPRLMRCCKSSLPSR